MGGGEAVAANVRTIGRRRGPSHQGAANGAAMFRVRLRPPGWGVFLDDSKIALLLRLHNKHLEIAAMQKVHTLPLGIYSRL